MITIPLSAIRQFIIDQPDDRLVNLMQSKISDIGQNEYVGCILGQYALANGIEGTGCCFSHVTGKDGSFSAKIENEKEPSQSIYGVITLLDRNKLPSFFRTYKYKDIKSYLLPE